MTPYPWPRDWQVGVQIAGGRLCWTRHTHLYMLWGLSSVDAQGHNLHVPLPVWAGPGFGAGGRGRDLEGSGSLSDEGTPAGETGQDQRWSAHLNPTLCRTHTSIPSLGDSLLTFRRCLCHQLIYLGLLVPGKNDVESFVICIGRGEMWLGARVPSASPSWVLSAIPPSCDTVHTHCPTNTTEPRLPSPEEPLYHQWP